MKNDQIRIKIIVIIFIFIIGTIFNIYFSTLLDEILSKEIEDFNIPKFKDAVLSLIEKKNHLYLFIAFQLTLILGIILYSVTNNKPYQSDLIKITPNIVTPASAGQKQFGSAKWMKDEEKDKAFSSCILNKNDKLIDYLIKHGHDDIKMEK